MADHDPGTTNTMVDISEYIERLISIQTPRQVFYMHQIISAEDLVAMYRTATILTACVAIAGDGVPADLKEETLKMAEGILWQHGQLTDPERNWTE